MDETPNNSHFTFNCYSTDITRTLTRILSSDILYLRNINLPQLVFSVRLPSEVTSERKPVCEMGSCHSLADRLRDVGIQYLRLVYSVERVELTAAWPILWTLIVPFLTPVLLTFPLADEPEWSKRSLCLSERSIWSPKVNTQNEQCQGDEISWIRSDVKLVKSVHHLIMPWLNLINSCTENR